MINSSEFINRLEKILEYYDVTASAFADKINVQRSSISHLLSGRNKPSLEFVLKVTDSFSEVDLQWLIKGEGSFPSSISKAKNSEVKDTKTQEKHKSKSKKKDIEKIIIFYTDGSFTSYEDKNDLLK